MLYCFTEDTINPCPAIVININNIYYYIWIDTFVFGEFVGRLDLRDIATYRNKLIYQKL